MTDNYDPKFLEWWEKYYDSVDFSIKMIAHEAWIARGHKEFMDKIDKDLSNEK